jgi:hypothetical protein
MTASSGNPAVDPAEFSALYERLQRVPPWGPADRRGGLNHITPDRVLAAAGATVTVTSRPARWTGSAIRCTCSRSTRSASICSTTCSSRASSRSARGLGAGRSSASSPRCECPGQPAHLSIRSRSCRPAHRRGPFLGMPALGVTPVRFDTKSASALHVVRLGVVRLVVDELVARWAVPAGLDRSAAGEVAGSIRRIDVPGAPLR